MKLYLLFFASLFFQVCAVENPDCASLFSRRQKQPSNTSQPQNTPPDESPCDANISVPEPLPHCWFLEFRTAYFYPTSKHFRSFYSGGPIWGLEFNCKAFELLHVWLSAEYFSKKGKTSLDNPLKLTLIPLTIGVKWLYTSYQWVQPYFGIGLETLYVAEKTHSPSLLHSLHNWDFGVRFKTGFLTQFCNNFFIDLYTDYFVKTTRFYKPSPSSVVVKNPNLNYFNFGGAVGVVF